MLYPQVYLTSLVPSNLFTFTILNLILKSFLVFFQFMPSYRILQILKLYKFLLYFLFKVYSSLSLTRFIYYPYLILRILSFTYLFLKILCLQKSPSYIYIVSFKLSRCSSLLVAVRYRFYIIFYLFLRILSLQPFASIKC